MALKSIVTLTSGEDGSIVAESRLSQAASLRAKIREEALKNIQEAIEGIIEFRKLQQLPILSIVEISVAA
jgi:predicted RNase H-like HicB family nuclease